MFIPGCFCLEANALEDRKTPGEGELLLFREAVDVGIVGTRRRASQLPHHKKSHARAIRMCASLGAYKPEPY